MDTPMKKRVSYFYDPDVGCYSYGGNHLMKPHRMRITHELVTAYDMLPKLNVLRAKRATPVQMAAFHTDEYVQFLHKVTPETAEELTHNNQRFLLLDDNPAFEGLFEFCSISAGGSIAAAHEITSNSADIAINWSGGLHHAKKREASGFCYINDIVLCILELLRFHARVLYIDIDVHHGDGVEEAFYSSDRVMTCSFHKFGEFFPGTGDIEDRGQGKGKNYAVNVPLQDGCGDETFRRVFDQIIDRILDRFRPEAIVLQCGSDSLAGDRLGPFNMTHLGHSHCVQFVRSKNIPLILLGGGGYTVKNASRAWAYETACALGIEKDIDPKLPWNDYFEWFGPRYRLEVQATNATDENSDVYVQQIIEKICGVHLAELPPVPSVGMQDVPRESVVDHLGLQFSSSKALPRSYGDDWRADLYDTANDDLDMQIAVETKRVYEAQKRKHKHISSSSSESDEPISDLSDSTSSEDPLSPHAAARRRKRLQQRRESRGRGNLKVKQRMSIASNVWKDVGVKEPVDPVGWYEGEDQDRVERERAPRYFRSDVGWAGMIVPEDAWRETMQKSIISEKGRHPAGEDEEIEDDEDEEVDGQENEEEEAEVDEDQVEEDEDEEGEIKMEDD